jgi:hypothetical protein
MQDFSFGDFFEGEVGNAIGVTKRLELYYLLL